MKRGVESDLEEEEEEEEKKDQVDEEEEDDEEEEEEDKGADPALFHVVTRLADLKPLPEAWLEANVPLARVLLEKERMLCLLFEHRVTPLIQAMMNAYALGLGRLAFTLNFVEEACPRVEAKKRSRFMQLSVYAEPLVKAGLLTPITDKTEQLKRAGRHKHVCVCYTLGPWRSAFLPIYDRLVRGHQDLARDAQREKLCRRAVTLQKRAQKRAIKPPTLTVTTTTKKK